METKFDHYPKVIKKAIRYIKQDAPTEQLQEIQRLLESAIKIRTLKMKYRD